MPHEPRRATTELLHLLARTRPDWREGDILQVIRHLETLSWPWARILVHLPRTAAEPDARPGDVIAAWRHPNRTTGQPPSEDYRAARQALGHQPASPLEPLREGVREGVPHALPTPD
ncbi:hypothetical protein [Microtetraspora malaysiensis]|uniref:hypothetical protein n=1 Tax=Microtetraspora malaysiensis TaxID=161358 RepID=UPI003D8FCE02